MRPGSRLAEFASCALVLFALSYSWFFASAISVPNERTRAYLTVALVDEGSIVIDQPLRRYGRILDLARYEKHYFTDKAPGSSFMAVPVYWTARLFRSAESIELHELLDLIRTWLMLPMALAGFVLLRRLLSRLGVSWAAREVASVGFALGSAAFHYGTAFYGHVLVSTLLLAALVCFEQAGAIHGEVKVSKRHYLGFTALAGAAAGLMGLTEYQAIVVSALFALVPLLGPRELRLSGVLAYGLGALPFAAALLVYNAHAFGGPFELSYHHLASKQLQELHGFGLAGATLPTVESVTGLLLSEHRGLITTSPLMGLGFLGLWLARARVPRGLWLTSLSCVLYFVLIVASSSVWYGGWSFGPRLLVPILPLLALFAALLADYANHMAMRWLTSLCVLIGVVYHGLVQLTFAELPPSVQHPMADTVRPMLEAGILSPNLSCKLAGAAQASAWPALLAMLVVCALVALAGAEANLRARLVRAAASIGGAALVLAFLWHQSPSTDAKEHDNWLKFTRGASERELSCAQESAAHDQAR